MTGSAGHARRLLSGWRADQIDPKARRETMNTPAAFCSPERYTPAVLSSRTVIKKEKQDRVSVTVRFQVR